MKEQENTEMGEDEEEEKKGRGREIGREAKKDRESVRGQGEKINQAVCLSRR